MSHDVRGGYPVIVAEYRKEVCKRLQLVRGWFLVMEVSDQRDSDRFVVHAAGLAVSAALLTNPPRGHFNLAIAFSKGPVIDQEMIPEAIPETALPVRAVYGLGVSLSGGCVVHDDVFPLRVPVEVYNVAYHPGVRDDEFLPHLQRIVRLEPVRRVDGFGLYIIHPGDPPDRFHWPDLMINGPGAAKITDALLDHLGWSAGPGHRWRACRRRG